VIEAGASAPDFRLPDQDGNQVSPADFRGRRLLLVFYPADFSPVCTDQLSVYQDSLAEFERRGVALVGISVDSAFSHKAFRNHLGVTMPLLADFHPKGEVARAYGLWSEDYGVAGRALVLIGPDGIVEWAHRTPALEYPGVEEIFQKLESLEPQGPEVGR
jgi:peroxiredoxin